MKGSELSRMVSENSLEIFVVTSLPAEDHDSGVSAAQAHRYEEVTERCVEIGR
jgi:hypothetical protein